MKTTEERTRTKTEKEDEIWDEHKKECVYPSGLIKKHGKCVKCCPDGKIWDEHRKECICPQWRNSE
jgi:hypothetical protein